MVYIDKKMENSQISDEYPVLENKRPSEFNLVFLSKRKQLWLRKLIKRKT
jgi:hypothetical protein